MFLREKQQIVITFDGRPLVIIKSVPFDMQPNEILDQYAEQYAFERKRLGLHPLDTIDELRRVRLGDRREFRVSYIQNRHATHGLGYVWHRLVSADGSGWLIAFRGRQRWRQGQTVKVGVLEDGTPDWEAFGPDKVALAAPASPPELEQIAK